jgi:hypothetical protein
MVVDSREAIAAGLVSRNLEADISILVSRGDVEIADRTRLSL